MSRFFSLATFITAGLLSLVSLSGCANFLEGRSVNRFQSAWNDQDLNRLRSQSSERFQRTALYRNDIQDDLKQLNLPEGKLSVTHVEKTEDGRKKVRVSADGSNREMQYILVKEKTSGKWVVDDIRMQQRRSRGLKVVRSVSEQMNLLQGVRDFREAWRKGDRHRMLAMLAPELRNEISSLPRGYFQKLSQDISEKMKMNSKADRKPKAELNGKDAIVSIRGAKGKVILQMKADGDYWQIEDFAIEGNDRNDHIPSMKKLAHVLNTSINFLDAYARSDLKMLERISHRDLFRGGLSSADLESVPLPTSAVAQNDYDIILKKHRAEFVINTAASVVKLSLLKDIAPTENAEAKDFVVSEVTIYDRHSPQKTELTAAFMGHAIVEIFRDRLAKKDIRYLKEISTKDFNNRVWNEMDQTLIEQMPLDSTISATPLIVRTEYRGVVSRIHVLQGRHPMIYVLRKEGGRILVDDIESSKPGFEKSLKSVMQAMIPVRKFAAGVIARNPRILQRISSKDFNRLIWKHVDYIPPTALFIPNHTRAPLHSIRRYGNDIIVTLGDSKWGARFALVDEYGKYLIDDIQLISGEMPHERLTVKHALRTEVSNGIRSLAASRQQPATNIPHPRELSPYANGRELTPRNGSIANFPARENRALPADPSFQNGRVIQAGYDRPQQTPTREFRSSSLPTQQPGTTPPSFENLATQYTESILPDRNAFGVTRKPIQNPPQRMQHQQMPYRSQQQPAMNRPTSAGQIPMPKDNPFDTTSKQKMSSPAVSPASSNSSSKVPLWDSFPGNSSSGNPNSSNRPNNQWSNWESQETGQSKTLQNRRMTTPSRTDFENRQTQGVAPNTPSNRALNPPHNSGTIDGGSHLQLAPGIPSGNPRNSPARNPFTNDEASGTRR